MNYRYIAVSAFVGFALGFLVFDQREENERLRKELEEARERGVEASAPARKSNSLSRTQIDKNAQNDTVVTANIEESEDLRENAHDLEARRIAGEYILESEHPSNRDLQYAHIARLAANVSSNNAGRYSALFSELGVPHEESVRLQKHLEKIALASMKANAAIQELLQARVDFQDRASSIMGEEAYKKYTEFEDASRAELEKNTFVKYLDKRQQTLPPEREAELTDSILQAEAYTHMYTLGPRDPVPSPAVGREMVEKRLREEASFLNERGSAVLSRLVEHGWSEEEWQPVYDYYSNNIANRAAMISENANFNPIERLEQAKKRFADRKKSPAAAR